MSILSKIIKVANSIDERLTGGAVTRKAINAYIKEYGEVIDLKIDNRAKTIAVSLLLKGETSTIKVNVGEYELNKSDGNEKITVKSASAERAWINAALQKFVVGKSFKLPAKSVDFVNDFLA